MGDDMTMPDIVSLRGIEFVKVLSCVGLVGRQGNIRWRPPHQNSKDLRCIRIRSVFPSRFARPWRKDTRIAGVRVRHKVCFEAGITAKRAVFVGSQIVPWRAILGAIVAFRTSRCICAEYAIPVRQIIFWIIRIIRIGNFYLLAVENLELR